MKKKLLIILMIIVVAGIAIAGFYFYQLAYSNYLCKWLGGYGSLCPTKPVSENQTWVPSGSWKAYTNSKHGFSFTYPQDFIVGENDFSTNFGLVLCPSDKIQINPNNKVSCAVKSAMKGEYVDGMIYLFTYDDNNIVNKEAYNYLGQNPKDGKFYYLYAATDRFPGHVDIIKGISNTFKFTK